MKIYSSSRRARIIKQEDIVSALEKADSISDAAAMLGVQIRTLRKHAEKYGLYLHAKKPCNHETIPIEDILLGNHPTYSSHKLRLRLIETGIKDKICEGCGRTKWQYKDKSGDISLELHHKNGIRTDHRLDNLELICGNCHAFTMTWKSRNANGEKKIRNEIFVFNPNHPLSSKAKSSFGYVRKSIIVAEAMIGRNLLSSDFIVYKNGNRYEITPENIEIVNRKEWFKRRKSSKNYKPSVSHPSTLCKTCLQEFKTYTKNQRFCSRECKYIGHTHQIPSRQELEIHLESNKLDDIAKHYSVSRATILTWRKKYDLPKRKRKNTKDSVGTIGRENEESEKM